MADDDRCSHGQAHERHGDDVERLRAVAHGGDAGGAAKLSHHVQVGHAVEHLQKVREHIGQGKDRNGLEDIAALKLGQARGVAIVAAVNQELPVFEYAARQVKQTVVGIGSAEKSQVQHMVRTLLKLPANPQADAADALAIAITHCHVSQNAMQMSESRLNLARGRLR